MFDKLRRLRLNRGLTQEAFAEQAQISYKYYQALEAGRKVDVRLSTLERLAKAHELEPWELLQPELPELAVAEVPAKYHSSRRSKR
ncbi:MAG: helix-turn-helix domain-containing protein [Opitutus sp.]